MIHIQDFAQGGTKLTQHLSPLAVWAFAFGSAVGWGSFVMPGTTFLPVAGPWGSVIGLFVGMGLMMVIGWIYCSFMKRYPNAGGSYTFASKVLGGDHGFLCAWMLLLTYAAIVWANSTALSLILRCLFGDFFCFGFSYDIAGYTVYMGELLLSTGVLALACLICILGRRVTSFVQTLCALLLFGGVAVCFAAVVLHRGGLGGIAPAFSQNDDPAVQVLMIAVLAPWAFIGFESVSHASQEFRFNIKKTMPILIGALFAGALVYVMLTLCAAMAVPDGFQSWSEYIGALAQMEGVQALPTFYAAREAMGTPGLALLGVAAFGGIATGLIGNLAALSRLMYRLSADGILPKGLHQLNRRGIPAKAVLCLGAISVWVPLLGRTAIGWIVDVTTIGATVVYACVAICTFAVGRREKRVSALVFGALGMLVSAVFAVFLLLPFIRSQSELASESYLILMVWCVSGMLLFRVLMQRDKTRRIGKSIVVWIVLFVLILLLSVSWINRVLLEKTAAVTAEMQATYLAMTAQTDNGTVTDVNRFLVEPISDFSEVIRGNVFVFTGLILATLALIFSIFSIIKQREKQSEAERLLAEENSRAKSAFLSNMSHDIRTPMNAVTGYTALALREEGIPDSIRTYLEKIDAAGKQLLALINDILEMSRIESGKTELDTAPADLCAVIEDACQIFDIQMKAKPLEYTVDVTGIYHRYVVCDKTRINRLLLNLISNAYKYTPAGGSVMVSGREIAAGTEACMYELTVSDTGIGMTPEFTAHIFDAYERESSRTVSNIQGTGLGMAIAKSFVELMGGTISVRSKKGQGTTFTVRLQLPLADEADVRTRERTASGAKRDGSGIRVLLAEDNPINSEIAAMILTQEGFDVVTVDNGKRAVEALAEADEDTYSVVLMDIQMPVLNGYDATRQIRAMEGKRGQIPIIALTANTFESDRREAFEAGMNAHVTKPLQPDRLVSILLEWAEK